MNTLTSFASTSSSLALSNIFALRSPQWNFSASPLIYSAFLSDRPAVRRNGIWQSKTWVGVGKTAGTSGDLSGVLWNRPINLFLMLFAAAPETCCEMMLLQRLSKGSNSSARPSGENTRQWWRSIRGFILASTDTRCAHACSNKCCVVVVGFDEPLLMGDESTTSFEWGTSRDPPGVLSVAFVPWGSAGRLGNSFSVSILFGVTDGSKVPCEDTWLRAFGICGFSPVLMRFARGVEGEPFSVELVLPFVSVIVLFVAFWRVLASVCTSSVFARSLLEGSLGVRALLRRTRLKDILNKRLWWYAILLPMFI